MEATAWQESSVTSVGATAKGDVTGVVGAGPFWTEIDVVPPFASTTATVTGATMMLLPTTLVVHWPVAPIVKWPPLEVTVVGFTVNPAGWVIWYGGRPPNTITSALTPVAQVFESVPTKETWLGCALSGALLADAMVTLVLCVKPDATSVICSRAVWGVALGSARTRMRAVPDESVVVEPVVAVVSGSPGADVMTRRSPDRMSNLTVRPVRGTPAWLNIAVTTASPPAQTAVPQFADWLALGVTVTELLIVRGFTVRAAVAGSEPAL